MTLDECYGRWIWGTRSFKIPFGEALLRMLLRHVPHRGDVSGHTGVELSLLWPIRTLPVTLVGGCASRSAGLCPRAQGRYFAAALAVVVRRWLDRGSYRGHGL